MSTDCRLTLITNKLLIASNFEDFVVNKNTFFHYKRMYLYECVIYLFLHLPFISNLNNHGHHILQLCGSHMDGRVGFLDMKNRGVLHLLKKPSQNKKRLFVLILDEGAFLPHGVLPLKILSQRKSPSFINFYLCAANRNQTYR